MGTIIQPNMAALMEKNLVKEMEVSFQTCISTLLSQDKIDNGLPNKIGLESSIEKFLESSRSLEGYFAKCQMYNSVNHPQDIVREEIIQLKEELHQKDGLLNSLKDKTIHWNHELNNLINKQNNMYTIEERKQENN